MTVKRRAGQFCCKLLSGCRYTLIPTSVVQHSLQVVIVIYTIHRVIAQLINYRSTVVLSVKDCKSTVPTGPAGIVCKVSTISTPRVRASPSISAFPARRRSDMPRMLTHTHCVPAQV